MARTYCCPRWMVSISLSRRRSSATVRAATASAKRISRIMKRTPSRRKPSSCLSPGCRDLGFMVVAHSLPEWQGLCVVVRDVFDLDRHRGYFDNAISPVDNVAFRSNENVISVQQENLLLASPL